MGLQRALTLFTQLPVGGAAQHLSEQAALCCHGLCRGQVVWPEWLRSQIAAYQPQPTRKQGWLFFFKQKTAYELFTPSRPRPTSPDQVSEPKPEQREGRLTSLRLG